MKIMHITNDYYNSKVYRNLNRHLLLRNIDSVMFVPLKKQDVGRPKEEKVINANCFNQIDRYFFFLKQNKIIKAIKRNLEKEKPDCLHAHFVFSSGFACMKLNQKYKIPYIVAVQNTDVNIFFKKMVHLRRVGIQVLQNAEAIVFMSPAYRDFVINKYVPKNLRNDLLKKTIVIPFGFDCFWVNNLYIKNKSIEERRIHLITVGTINKNKNQLAVVKAAEILKNRGYKIEYTIAGNIEDETVFQELKKYDFVNYVGRVPKEKLINIYRQADIFILPSFTETFGLVYVEAMSQGLPVIYTENQGFSGQFPEGEIGFGVLPDNPSNIVENILKCLEGYHKLSTNCVKNVSTFNWSKIVEKYEVIYKEIIK